MRPWLGGAGSLTQKSPWGNPGCQLNGKQTFKESAVSQYCFGARTASKLAHTVVLKPVILALPVLIPLWRFVITGRRFFMYFIALVILSSAALLSGREKTPIKSCRCWIMLRSKLGRRNICFNRVRPWGLWAKRRKIPYTDNPSLLLDGFVPGPWLNRFGWDSCWIIWRDCNVLLLIHLSHRKN